jgi:hypothetical protein
MVPIMGMMLRLIRRSTSAPTLQSSDMALDVGLAQLPDSHRPITARISAFLYRRLAFQSLTSGIGKADLGIAT